MTPDKILGNRIIAIPLPSDAGSTHTMNVIVKVRPRTEAEEEALNTDLFRLLRLDSDDPWTDQVASNTAVELAVEA